ncbi:MAG TPA: 50S ribosomal protein L3 N(5)-glutamine methyltransferase [Burkholderiaceae bacterium]|nr:50S ribosomal protein L3 N(5)-glutamine methyltransferase [Burkholderiaceae bacterium]
MTVIELIERASARLDQAGVSFGQGTTNAFDEAAWLVLWRLQLPLDALDEVAEREVDEPAAATVDALIARRIDTRQPAAYLTGEAWLQGVPFTADARSIVPRSLIAEVLADGTIDAWLQGPPSRVLDLCTGSGSLAVLAAQRWPAAAVDATDLSRDALQLACINVERHDLTDRITLHQCDSFGTLHDRYDLILCNPPYVNARSMSTLPPEFQAEPVVALAGGDDGMDFVRRVITESAAHLLPHGVLVLEIGHEREHFDAAFGALEAVGLPTSEGDDAVLLLTRDALERT